MILCALKYGKRIGHMLNVLNTHMQYKKKKNPQNMEVMDMFCGDGNMGICIHPNSTRICIFYINYTSVKFLKLQFCMFWTGKKYIN